MKQRGNRSSKTIITTVRLTNEQVDILKTLPKLVSASVLIRTLLKEYFAGNLPQIHAKVIEEVVRTQKNMYDSRF